MKQLEVTILGQSYVLGCPEGGEALLRQAVARVDQEMSGIRDAGKVKARERMAVLAALNLAYQLAQQGRAASPSATPAATLSPGGAAVGDEAVLQQLISRIDAVLGNDGQLL